MRSISIPLHHHNHHNPLHRWSQWLGSISEIDAQYLRLQPEYEEFLAAMQRLEQAHIAILNNDSNRSIPPQQPTPDPTLLSHSSNNNSTDPPAGISTPPPQRVIPHHHSLKTLGHLQSSLLLRIFDFLDCRDLVRASRTSHRWYHWVQETASLRVRSTATPQLSALQHVRLAEQWSGWAAGPDYHLVPFVVRLLRRRIVVSQCDDADCNGVYCCAEVSGNGFVFSKPCGERPNGRVRILKRFSGTVRTSI